MKPWRVGHISNVSFEDVRAVNVSWSRTPWYWPHCQHCDATSTVDTIAVDGAPATCNKTGPDPTPCYMRPTAADARIVNVTMRNISLRMFQYSTCGSTSRSIPRRVYGRLPQSLAQRALLVGLPIRRPR